MQSVTYDVATRHTGTFHHVYLKNADDTPVRCRVNGACKTWRRLRGEFRLPVKYGLRECFYITPVNAVDWQITDEDWREVCRKMLCERVGLAHDAPDFILRDKAMEDGLYEGLIESVFGVTP